MRKSKTLYVFVLFISALAVLLSLYLTFAHYTTADPLCFSLFGIGQDCDAVNQGAYSEIFGIPVASIGLLGFLLIFLLSLVKLCDYDVVNEWMKEELAGYAHTVLFFLCFIGVVFAGYFTYVEAYVINTFCSLCLLTALLMLILFLISVVNLFVDI